MQNFIDVTQRQQPKEKLTLPIQPTGGLFVADFTAENSPDPEFADYMRRQDEQLRKMIEKMGEENQ